MKSTNDNEGKRELVSQTYEDIAGHKPPGGPDPRPDLYMLLPFGAEPSTGDGCGETEREAVTSRGGIRTGKRREARSGSIIHSRSYITSCFDHKSCCRGIGLS